MVKTALISKCGKYRYKLSRIWDRSKPFVLFIMHNPSTADADNDDPTIRRCIAFAKSWGYGGIMVGNISPYRATDPKELRGKIAEELFPMENIDLIYEMKELCQLHVFAYGNPIPEFKHNLLNLGDWHCIKLSKNGNPCHPLYLKGDLKPIPFPYE